MTTEEPMANLSWNQEQFTAYLLGLTEKRIAEEERMLPCSACLACQWTTCRKGRGISIQPAPSGPTGGDTMTTKPKTRKDPSATH